MSLFDSLFTVLQVKDLDMNRVQYNIKTAFVSLEQSFAQALSAAFKGRPIGSTTVTITNAPAGVSSAPARYVTLPDGKGGVYTFISLT